MKYCFSGTLHLMETRFFFGLEHAKLVDLWPVRLIGLFSSGIHLTLLHRSCHVQMFPLIWVLNSVLLL